MSAAAETSPTVLPATSSAASAQTAGRGVRLLLALTAVALALAGLFAALALAGALAWWSQPFAGVLTTPALTVDGSDSLAGPSWPGVDAGLRPGDQLAALNGQALTDAASLQAALAGMVAGDTVSVQTAASPTPITYSLTAFPTGDWLLYFGVPFAAGLVLLIAGLALTVLRSTTPNALVTALMLAAASAMMGT